MAESKDEVGKRPTNAEKSRYRWKEKQDEACGDRFMEMQSLLHGPIRDGGENHHSTTRCIIFLSAFGILVVCGRIAFKYYFEPRSGGLTWMENLIDAPNDHFKDDLPEMKSFREKWIQIKREFTNYNDSYYKCISSFGDIVKSQKRFGEKWKTVVLRIYGRDTVMMNAFPVVKKLITNHDGFISFAMFSIFQPGTVLTPHYGFYNGVFRYQLALQVPNVTQSKLYLKIFPGPCGTLENPGHRKKKSFLSEERLYHWVEGTDFMFDDTCEHEAQNLSDESRVILFLDVERNDLRYSFQTLINRLYLKWFAPHISTVVASVENQNELSKNCEPMRRLLSEYSAISI